MSRCVVNKDIDVLVMATHTHGLGRDTEVFTFDRTSTGAQVCRNDDWSNPKLLQLGTPLHVPAGQGFEFHCHYQNPTDLHVTYGLSAQEEMCNLTLVFMPMDPDAKCTQTYQSNGAHYGVSPWRATPTTPRRFAAPCFARVYERRRADFSP
jgi:hypothetical protein